MKTRVCIFFSRDGFCADGEHCDFLHDTVRRPPEDTVRTRNCKFYNSDSGCMYGDSCMYAHTSPQDSTSYASIVGSQPSSDEAARWHSNNVSGGRPVEKCKFYMTGSCAYGDRCRYSHDEDLSPKPLEPDLDLECGICMSKINGCQIGMLSHCNCLFCLNCIRSWRKDGLEISGPSQVRLCPLCRKESHFTMPTYTYVTDPTVKERLINEYRRVIGNTPCKHFTEENKYVCPFGSSCFYKHVDDTGKEVVKEAPRLVIATKDTGETSIESAKSLSLGDFIRIDQLKPGAAGGGGKQKNLKKKR